MSEHPITKDAYIEWILKETNPGFEVFHNDENQILLYSDLGIGEIHFYQDDLVEMSIISRKDNQMKFYLHFQLQDEDHAKGLFKEMEEALEKLTSQDKIKVLLSCTSGATTTFFAEKLNESVRNLDLDYEFAAVPYTSLFETAPDYDVIMIAPQIGYLYKKLKEAIPDKLVLRFPTAAFAGFNSLDTLDYIRDEIAQYRADNAASQMVVQEKSCAVKTQRKILTIGAFVSPDITRCFYRVYGDQEILLQDYLKVPVLTLDNLKDIIHLALSREPDITMIGLAIPGIIGHEQKSYALPKSYEINETVDLQKALFDKFDREIVVVNNANAAVQGLAYAHPEYKSLAYFSLPFGFYNGGLGAISDGHLIYGQGGIAGEVFLYTGRMQYSNTPARLAHTDLGQMEIVINTLLPVIGILGPEVIFLRTPVVNDMAELHKNLAGFIPEEYIPRLEYVPDVIPFMLDGILGICKEKLHAKDEQLTSSGETPVYHS